MQPTSHCALPYPSVPIHPLISSASFTVTRDLPPHAIALTRWLESGHLLAELPPQHCTTLFVAITAQQKLSPQQSGDR